MHVCASLLSNPLQKLQIKYGNLATLFDDPGQHQCFARKSSENKPMVRRTIDKQVLIVFLAIVKHDESTSP